MAEGPEEESPAVSWIRNNTLLIVLAFWFVFLIVPHVSPWEGLNDNLRIFQRFNRWGIGRIEELFDDHGYWVVFIAVLLENSMFLGLVVPGAIILILAGLTAENGDINIWWVFALGMAATILGDTISYLIGRLGWMRAIQNSSLGPSIERVRERMEGHTTWLILVYHFAGYSRMVGPLAAGIFRVPYGRWALLDHTGAALWVVTFTMAGYFLGLSGVEFSDTKTIATIIEWGLFALLVVMVVVIYTRAVRSGTPPDASAIKVPVEEL